ncbi:hypothetical protein OGAPHI_002340 [Ogataea philodendri]|uniref:ATP-dependent bile acid permease n=1 Tax=Ogataea philodendri TaxID=1378263 RepID=A0A9P8T832_9ASCO|nr:uncharacterized protein OGAPHI_002340 [Ogataea philodendri]KAH3668586.1 hypothetical protein OGAPHI_002340 [Ogataea philodendri]
MIPFEQNSTICHSYWYNDDFTVCGREFAQLWIVFPLAISLYLVLNNLFHVVSVKNKTVSAELDSEQQPLLEGEISEYNATKEGRYVSTLDRHFDISLLNSGNAKSNETIRIVYRDTSEKIKVVLEEALLFFQIGLSTIELLDSDNSSSLHRAKLVNLGFWTYLTLITSIRLFNVSKGLGPEWLDLWKQCSFLYNIQLPISALLFRSAILNHVSSSFAVRFYLLQFAINVALVLINGLEKCSDKPARVYEKDGILPSPETTSTLFSIISFSWIDRMIFNAYKRPITMPEIWGLRYQDLAEPLLSKYHESRATARFAARLFSQFKVDLIMQCVYSGVDSLMELAPPIALKHILEYIQDPDHSSTSLVWLWVIISLVGYLSEAILISRCQSEGRRIDARLRAVLVGELYAKALRRKLGTGSKTDEKHGEEKPESPEEETEPETKDMGGVLNLMSVDTFKVSELGGNLYNFTSAISMTIATVILLYQLLGWSSLMGVATLACIIPTNYFIAMSFEKYQTLLLSYSDQRIQKLNEVFQNIRVIKYFAWENKFTEAIMKLREKEIYYVWRRAGIWALAVLIWYSAPSLVALVTFFFYTAVQGERLTTPVAFTALSLFNLLRSPLDMLGDLISFVLQTKVSIGRIEKYLNEPETTKYEQLTTPRGPNSPAIGFENATLHWSKNSKNSFALRDINIEFKPGKINIIFGATGSGKTSLLLALLGEMDLEKGSVYLPGADPREDLIPNPVTGLTESVAYCSQTAWLLNTTIKENIMFGSPYDKKRFDAVIHSCGLTRDLEILDWAEETEIGEKGITLSGGQKQRVSLARALYSSASYVLLDDCLSAVDSHTAVHIYENCIKGNLMKGRTCLLVSHNVALTVKDADHVILMDNGRVKAQGSVGELLSQGHFAEDTIKSMQKSRSESSELDQIQEPEPEVTATKSDSVKNDKKSKLIQEETKSEGHVKLSVYLAYLKHLGSVPYWLFLVATIAGSQSALVGQSYWLRFWAAMEDKKISIEWNQPIGSAIFKAYGFELENQSTVFYVGVYTFIGLMYATIVGVRFLTFLSGGLNVSKSMFGELLDKVLHAKLRFFDQTPIGRIMNRFSKDVEGVDQDLPDAWYSSINCLLSTATILAMVCVVTPIFMIFAIVLLALYGMVGSLYLNLSRDLKRFNSITKSPIHQHFSESLHGVATIRAYGDIRRFLRQNLDNIDTNNRPFWYNWTSNRWLGFRTEMIGTLISFFASVFAVSYARNLDAGLAGISLSFAVGFRQSAGWLIRMYSRLEIMMNSAERVQEYIEETPQEAERLLPQDPVNSWPSKGEIDVSKISIKYAPGLPRVIDDVSFKVNSAEKIGVVGRTGAGKSTIVTSFFRFVELDSGSIKIDGLDISKIGLTTLRKGLTIIPQDPTLFAGTVRSNLDIFQEYSDLQMFESLRRVNLISGLEYQGLVNHTLPDQSANTHENTNKFLDLDSAVLEGGSNLSQGERQLICLARSLLKVPKILMLDEATASIDYESDAKIQTTIREEFSSSTILTIAHRLKTIIDYDKILLLDQGKVKEFDHPYKLITNVQTEFYKMCVDTGELDELVHLAEQAYQKQVH